MVDPLASSGTHPVTNPQPVTGAQEAGRLTYYACGHTTHKMSQLIKGFPLQRRIFPAGVFLYHHPDGTKVLFDTGYGPNTARAGIKGFLYHQLLPANILPEQSIEKQLAADGIHPDDVTYVVLSHLHPDHIGGVRYFPNATFVMTAAMLETFAKARVKEGFLPKLLPAWFPAANTEIISFEPDQDSFDLLGDGRYQLVSLPGHARGHVGALIEGQVLLAGDASWGHDLMGESARVKAVPRAITDDWAQYETTLHTLAHWETKGVRLCFSHDHYDHKELLN